MFLKKRYAALGVIGLALVLMMSGCEGEKSDNTGADDYFKKTPYSSDERLDPILTDLVIEPGTAKIDIVGQEIIFTASGGDGKYNWYISNDNGEINSHGANQCSYKCITVGNNDVIVQDGSGHYAAAHITPAIDDMTVKPSSVTLAGGASYVSFTVSGGTAPYFWTSGNTSLGTVSYSSSTTYTAAYTAIAGAYGQNTITVSDAEGQVATAAVIQTP